MLRTKTIRAAAAVLAILFLAPAAEAAEKRIALVVGNAAYQAGPIATAANDAGLVAQTLQAAGFDVVGARDLDEDGLRRSLRDFVDKATASGPDTVTFVYLAGYGLQLEGENYFAPVDLRVGTAADVGLRALRVSDYTKGLAAIPLKARFLVLDAARATPFAVPDKPLAGGLALSEAEPGSLLAFNAAPGTVGPVEKGPYGAYAQALAEMIREGGLPPAALFDRVRLRVDSATRGAEVPWDAAHIEAPFVFLERQAGAPALGQPDRVAALRRRPLREVGVQDAYALCLERDDLAGYQAFVADYPGDPLAARVRALIAARREALVWRRTWIVGTPDAYWSYLGRYPRGPHAWDARRRLASLAAALEPPPRFTAIYYDEPPPPPEEIVYVARPVLFLDDPVYALAAPPPLPVVFLPPPPAYWVELAPPPPVVALYALPMPPLVPVPAYVSAPASIAPPQNNVVFQNIHNTTVIERINRQNAGAPVPSGAVTGAVLGAAAAQVALPPALQRRSAQPQALAPQGAAAAPAPASVSAPARALASPPTPRATAQQAVRAAPGAVGPGRGLPGMNGQPLPRQAGRAAPPAPDPAPRGFAAGAGRSSSPDPIAVRRAAVDAQRRQDAFAGRAAQAAQNARQAQMAQRQQQVQMDRRQQAQRFAQQRQAGMAAERAQMAARRQQQAMMHQQQAQAAAQRQMMARPQPRPAPDAGTGPGHGGGHPHCHPGQPCR